MGFIRRKKEKELDVCVEKKRFSIFGNRKRC
jgi:hypothetical protein